MLPSFSMEAETGKKKTSVFTCAGSKSGPFQKEAVSLSNRLTATIQSSLASALRTLPALLPEQAGFCPQAKKPLMPSLNIRSKSISQEAFWPSSSLGSNW